MIIFNEVEYVQNLLEVGYINPYFRRFEDISLIIKYYKFQGKKKAETKQLIKEFLNKFDKLYDEKFCNKDTKKIDKTINMIYKRRNSLRVGLNVSVSLNEIEEIIKLKTKKQKTIAFVMLVLDKFYTNKTGVFRAYKSDIAKLANVTPKHTNKIINTILEKGLFELVDTYDMKDLVKNRDLGEKISHFKSLVKPDDNIIYTVESMNNDVNLVEEFNKCMAAYDNNINYDKKRLSTSIYGIGYS